MKVIGLVALTVAVGVLLYYKLVTMFENAFLGSQYGND